jgi:hypothetical protein
MRIVGIALAAVGMLGLLLIPLAAWNPWRLIVFDRVVRPLPVVLILVIAGGLIVVGGFVGLRGRGARVVAGLVVPVTVTGAIFPGLPALWADAAIGSGRGEDRGVVAVSPDNRFEIIELFELYGVDNQVAHFVLRTRAGWLSRQGDGSIADCARFGAGGPGAVRFTAPTTVSITVDDRTTAIVHFDPKTLVADTKPTC